jgi:hypothetical protein
MGLSFRGLTQSRMKELNEENRKLMKMYLKEKLTAEIVLEALEKKW